MKIIITTLILILFVFHNKTNASIKLNSWQCQFSTDGVLRNNWSKSETGKECLKDKSPGYIFYKSIISIPSGEVGARHEGIISVFLGTIGEADELFLDGVRIGKTGGFPPFYLNSMHRPRIYSLGDSADLNGRELLLKVYSEFPINRGLKIEKVMIDGHVNISKKFFWEDFKANTGLALVLTLFIITALITFFMFVRKTHKIIHLWASITCFVMASYTFFLSRYGYELMISNMANYRALVSSAILITICLVGFSCILYKFKNTKLLIFIGSMNVLYLFYVQTFDSIIPLRVAYKNWLIPFIGVTFCNPFLSL